jgi:hypothetical protein
MMLSSRMPPVGSVMSVSVDAPGLRPATSATLTRSRKATRSLPVQRSCPMCPTSKSDAQLGARVCRCDASTPAGYCTGSAYPAKGTILPPSETCRSCSAVRASGAASADDDDAARRGAAALSRVTGRERALRAERRRRDMVSV